MFSTTNGNYIFNTSSTSWFIPDFTLQQQKRIFYSCDMDVNFSDPPVQFEKSNIILHRKRVLLEKLRDIFKYALIHRDKK